MTKKKVEGEKIVVGFYNNVGPFFIVKGTLFFVINAVPIS